MKYCINYQADNISDFKEKLIQLSAQNEVFCYLDNCNSQIFPLSFHAYDTLVAVGVYKEYRAQLRNNFDGLKDFHNKHKTWCFGYLSYDLKNEIEELKSENFDGIKLSNIHFFVPETLFLINKNHVKISSDTKKKDELQRILKSIINTKKENSPTKIKVDIEKRFTKNEYLEAVAKLQKHIQYGDIYEVNFCQEFYSNNAKISPISLYKNLKTISPTPYSAFYKFHDKYLICASPERYLRKLGNKIISQPIKGTAPRNGNKQKDLDIINTLKKDPKERAENIMITDLVRNDLTKTACINSVKVDELCQIYSFRQVHQMISTISAKLQPDMHFTEAIKHSFPMGSMTGAPKLRAMQIIEHYEKTQRGLFSGTIGYITPEGDFDFNVIIRSILYNETSRYLSFQVGGAITAKSIPENEYQECLLKAKAILQALKCNLPVEL